MDSSIISTTPVRTLKSTHPATHFYANAVFAVSFSNVWSLAMLALMANMFVGVDSIRAEGETPANAALLSQVGETLKRRDQSFTSVNVIYRSRSKVLSSKRAAKQYLGIIAEIDEIKSYAFKNPKKRYYRVQRESSVYLDISPNTNSPQSSDVGNQPKNELRGELDQVAEAMPGTIAVTKDEITAYDGDILRRKNMDINQGFVFDENFATSGQSDAQLFNNEFLYACRLTPTDVFHVYHSPLRQTITEMVTSQKCRVEERVVEIGGNECLQLFFAAGRGIRIWLDPAMNYAVRRWDLLAGPDASEPTLWRYTSSDFVEYQDGIWLPQFIERLRWGGAKVPGSLRDDPMVRYTFDVQGISVNDVPDRLFTLAFEVGMEIVDFKHSVNVPGKGRVAIMYPQPADGAQLDGVIESARKAINPQSKSVTGRSSRETILLIINIVVIAILVVAYMLRRRVKS